MKRATKAQIRQYVEQWKRAGPELERFHREELRRYVHDPDMVDSLLQIGDQFGQSRPTSGRVEMQKWFMKLARQQGLLPKMAREEPEEYRAKPKKGRSRGRR